MARAVLVREPPQRPQVRDPVAHRQETPPPPLPRTGRTEPPGEPGTGRTEAAGEPATGRADLSGDLATTATASVVVPTHNDGANIGPLLERLLGEPSVGELVVVASGCNDDTVPIVCRIADAAAGRADRRDGRRADGTDRPDRGRHGRADGADRAVPVHVYVEPERSGKTAAVNFGVGRCALPAVVIVSGDVLPAAGAVGRLVAALGDPGVGMAGGRPVPVNSDASILGAAVHVLWRLHHRLALRQPKLGEMVALRAEAAVLLPETSVDEACFQARLEAAGWRSRYVPEATVANRGPGTVGDFVKQRRQIHTGHLWLRCREGYTVPSLRPRMLLRECWAELRTGRHDDSSGVHDGSAAADDPAGEGTAGGSTAGGSTAGGPAALVPGDDGAAGRPLTVVHTVVAVGLELWARLLARSDYLRGRETHVWDMVASAKDPALGPHGVGARGR